jgi:hypothetical protein
VLEVLAGTDAETATLVWLMDALERAREEGQERLVGYLEAVADDAVFEAEAAARRGRLARRRARMPRERAGCAEAPGCGSGQGTACRGWPGCRAP